MMLGQLFCVMNIFLIRYIQESGATCTANSGGVYTFGPNCEYMCHCKYGGACDSNTGDCSNGCDTKWFGPGCQFRDLAENEESRHLDNLKNYKYASRANDGSMETCSYTNAATAARTIKPWWRVQFPQKETIQSMVFVTTEGKLHNFKGFKVTVENAPANKATDGGYYPPASNVQLCYQHSNYAPSNMSIHVTCDKPLEGNLVRIQLAKTDTQLVLCDVRINGGRNLAFMKNLEFSSPFDENRYPSTNAVDGVLRNNAWDYCFALEHSSSQTADWLTVNLGHLSFIKHISITKFNDNRIRYYQLNISNTTGDADADVVHDDTGNNNPNLKVTLQATGQFVKFKRSSGSPTVICELEIYGDCTAGKCGYDCSKECRCKTIEDKVSGVCTSGCEGRWTGPGDECINNCAEFQWGEYCTNQCGQCRNSQSCDVVTGYCPSGCRDGYMDTRLCNTECLDGTYGRECSLDCSGNCKDGDVCRKSDGYCERGCSDGYQGNKCDEECTSGRYGVSCTLSCSVNCYGGFTNCHHVNGTCLLGCATGFEGNTCDKECDNGFWNRNCETKCGKCLSGTCSKTTGFCEGGCLAGYKYTSRCTQECDDYTFGINCGSLCNPNCVDICDKVNGTCGNCTSGWKGDTCSQACGTNTWGENCERTCGFCLSGTCNRFTGRCTGGCLPGYKTTSMCNEKCPVGTYGPGCSGTCSTSCKVPGQCNNVNGHCESCGAGKQGDYCEKDCDNRSYGDDCSKECGACANNETCNSVSGHCKFGCNKGFKHSLLCQDECDDGSHGKNCTGVCGSCKPGTVCDKVTGVCHYGCSDKFTGAICVEALTQESKEFPIGGVVGGVVAVVVVIATVVLVFLFLRRRKAQLKSKSTSQIGFDTVLNQEKEENAGSVKRNNIYENSSEILAELASQNPSNVKNEVPAPIDEETTDIYYNEGPLAKRRSEHSIFVTDLKDYVKRRTANAEYFVQEFQKLPSGLQHPTSIAKKAGNAGKNRYKVMYAYDHSRVVLKTLPGNPDSDYINAAFIKGHFKDNAYIAAQGPIDFTLDDFWRMIWEKDVYTIVMATRLVEETKMKCVQYWAEAEDDVQYGEINVLTESVDIFAEFTIRHIKVSHQDNPDNVRNVTQFHYTAWPDKDVPRSTTSLLHFWYQVRKHDGQKNHPWLVHCSAGVGRTGTFIALDILYDQGKDQGFVDVFGCVRDLRDQRVSMVQTKEQYRYLHNMLVEILVLPSKPVHIDELPAVYSDLQEIDPTTGKTKLLLQYETLLDDTDSGSESEDTDEMYTSAKQTDNRNKNRHYNILAANEYRPYLFTQVKGCTNYINAVYIPGYCDTHGYIITQTPLVNTAIDCCRLVFEQDVKVIVTFAESCDEETGVYLPDSGSIKHGPFTITLVSEQDKGDYISKVHKLEFDSNEHLFTQLVCKQWPSGKITPDDPHKMLSFLQDLECIQRQTENKPVVAQCLNGAERSGLIVVLMNIMERVRFDCEVSIPQVIRQLQFRRQQIIPNFEQFEFCFCVLKAHADSNATYANV
ncbi:uncharacterized protein LOC123557913 isoform X2 [Mercenaria mercenaria]|uniref:uncharacterized protein LOC123557913 isoform X2 n=1 Tax=Mercenaria mercenaria TaxID=6596 RepID=UPI00234E5F54|nr:uncharacterized protein LOC123557913 isoform X2 [Mercenaria mercenaria]